jgi:hypothetical protein
VNQNPGRLTTTSARLRGSKCQPGDDTDRISTTLPRTTSIDNLDHRPIRTRLLTHRLGSGEVLDRRDERRTVRGIQLTPRDHHPRRIGNHRELTPLHSPRIERISTIRIQRH